MAVFQLDDDLWFPDPRLGEPDGLVAVGGDLSPARLLLAYRHGFFPWFSFHRKSTPYWYCPLRRFVIFPSEIHISHSMRQLIRQQRYTITLNKHFEGVIQGCATIDDRQQYDGAWLGPEMIRAYTDLHRLGYTHSVEVWQQGATEVFADAVSDNTSLVGGLYGVGIGRAFFGESMFSLMPNTSKLALIFLAQQMVRNGGRVIDCQFETPHLRSMGGRHIDYEEYLELIR